MYKNTRNKSSSENSPGKKYTKISLKNHRLWRVDEKSEKRLRALVIRRLRDKCEAFFSRWKVFVAFLQSRLYVIRNTLYQHRHVGTTWRRRRKYDNNERRKPNNSFVRGFATCDFSAVHWCGGGFYPPTFPSLKMVLCVAVGRKTKFVGEISQECSETTMRIGRKGPRILKFNKATHPCSV